MRFKRILYLLIAATFCAAVLSPTISVAQGGTAPAAQKTKSKKAKGKTSAKKTKKPKADVYICSMGDYEGPLTKDGRCPKCGMQLHKK
jgi:hypothetical protein